MSTIGVYDSGIGGLFTLAKLRAAIPHTDFYYLADNLNMPFGLKCEDELRDIVGRALKRLEKNADCSVLACNTASVTTRGSGVFRLMPRLDGLDEKSTLVMGTPLTLSRLEAEKKGFKCAHTAELASLVEIHASLKYKSRRPIVIDELVPYLENALPSAAGITRVAVGCSHYIYLENIIKTLLPTAVCDDGNDTLVAEVKSSFTSRVGSGKITFAFTGANESKKYEYIFENIQKTLFFGE